MRSNKRLLTIIILITIVATAGLLGACLDFSSPVNKINLSFDSEIIFENSIFVYTGEEIKPSVTVKHREEVVDAQNYTLVYSDNLNPGTATVKAEGKGDYYGSVSATFVIGYQYTFNVNGADKVDGEVAQTVVDKDMIIPPTVEKTGYDFLHWSIDSQPVDFRNIENLPSSGEFVANFVLKTYSVTYHLGDGANDPANREKYTVEDHFTLKDATLRGMQFAGWYLDADHKNRVTSLEGFAEDIELYAKFVDYTAKTIEYRVPAGADEIAVDYFMPEEVIDELNSQRAQIKEVNGRLKKLVWYGDENYYNRYFFREMPNADLIVYAQWEDVLQAGFLDKVEEFSSNNISIDSFEELVDYVDYVCYENIVSRLDQNNVPIDVDYVKITYVTKRDDIKSEIDKALIAATYPRMASISYAYQDGAFKIALTKDVMGNEASISATKEEDFAFQIGNIFALQSKGRNSDYDKFPIDFVENTYEVETSNQLFYVLSHGYRPLPKSGSKAEEVYDRYREIMRQICDDTMSDLEKARAIYEWIIIKVQYDNAVAYPQAGSLASDPNSTYLFDSFYLEGVLRGSAVCDGISKAYSVMCAIEGIDCVRVTGDDANGGSGHAWNKVRIRGNWYLSDATWGNAAMGDEKEILSYQYFLFTDADRENKYIKQNYTYYVANTEFDDQTYYSSRKIEIDSYTADFYIDSDEELSYLLDYIDVNFDSSQLAGFSFDIVINPNAIITNTPSDGDHSQSSIVLYSAMYILRARRGRYDQPKISINGIV
ncbi:MAG: InlB B-repeat-containing protein, partial [Clostridia bacterium]|nr:InlB B-repeat-containing protein [Clostridia bacterium]